MHCLGLKQEAGKLKSIVLFLQRNHAIMKRHGTEKIVRYSGAGLSKRFSIAG